MPKLLNTWTAASFRPMKNPTTLSANEATARITSGKVAPLRLRSTPPRAPIAVTARPIRIEDGGKGYGDPQREKRGKRRDDALDSRQEKRHAAGEVRDRHRRLIEQAGDLRAEGCAKSASQVDGARRQPGEGIDHKIDGRQHGIEIVGDRR